MKMIFYHIFFVIGFTTCVLGYHKYYKNQAPIPTTTDMEMMDGILNVMQSHSEDPQTWNEEFKSLIGTILLGSGHSRVLYVYCYRNGDFCNYTLFAETSPSHVMKDESREAL